MKKQLLLLFVLFPLAGFGQQPFSIEGKIDKLKKDDKVYLIYVAGGKRLIDSALVSNTPTFKFNGTIKAATKAELFLNKNPYVNRPKERENLDRLSFYVEPGTIKLSAKDSLGKAVISGSPVNADNKKLNALLKPALDKQKSLYSYYAKLTEDQRKDEKLMAEISVKDQGIWEEQSAIKLSFAKANPQSELSLHLLNELADGRESYVETKKVFQGLSPVLKASLMGKSIVEKFETLDRTSIGALAMDFEQNDVNGKAVKLSDFKGKYVLVDFWASWCGPCRGESPYLVAAYGKYKDKGLNILGVSADASKEAWQKAITDDKLSWTQVSDLTGNNPVLEKYGIRGIPSNFLIDPNGKIIASELRGNGLDKKLEEVFGK